MQPFTESNDAGETVEDPKPFARRRANKHSAIIRTQIKGGESRPENPAWLIGPRLLELRDRIKLSGCLNRYHPGIVIRLAITGKHRI
ncbi:MAG TPA: hypothetical protein PLD10_17220 [Rhodopila sp.]|nr:hypothetical protein [Rhodopila sp.]